MVDCGSLSVLALCKGLVSSFLFFALFGRSSGSGGQGCWESSMMSLCYFQVVRPLCSTCEWCDSILLYLTRIAEDKQMTRWEGMILMN